MSSPVPGGTIDDFLDDQPEEPPGDGDSEHLDGEEAEEEHPDLLDDQDEELLPEPPRGGASARGRQGLRTGSQAGSSGGASNGRRPALGNHGDAKTAAKDDDGKARAQRRPRGNLPTAPVFDGDKRKDPKCFKKYAAKVDSYVEIAKNIIDDSEIGLRLHAALEGEAADYLEDIPARTFGVESGWQVLLKLLQDKYDEKRMHKVGSAMQGFFKLNLSDRQYTMLETADAMDRAARRCREANLVIPDEIMIYFFFEHAQLSTERQANLLLRTSGEYDWKKLKQAVELLYQNVTVRAGASARPDQGHRGRQRGAHETHREEWDFWGKAPDWNATEEQLQNFLYDHDPVENLAECELAYEIPEDMARELHTCFQTHRENRQRLAKAVQARGFYVGGSKGKAKGSKGAGKGKGKSKGKKGLGKAPGMSLEELKAKTTCAICGQVGHWKGDPQCRGKSANEASRTTVEENTEDAEDWYGYDGEYTAEQWAAWEAERYGYEERSTYVASRPTTTSSPTPTAAPTTTPTTTTTSSPSAAALEAEARAVARGINRVRGRAKESVAASAGADAATQVKTDRFLVQAEAVKEKIKSANMPVMSPSPAPEAVKKAFEHFGLTMATPTGATVRELLDNSAKAVDVESLRKAMVATRAVRTVDYDFSLSSPRAVHSNMRRSPTVSDGKTYLTLDTACENTVAGTSILQSLNAVWERRFSLQPKIEPESETYCFGPGEPVTSLERWYVPIGIRGANSVICSSSIPDTVGSKIPFLAGQDWLVFVDACIDVGRSEVVLRELNVTAPIYIDVTGHLVLAIDEIEEWPKGVVARKNGYPGVLFEGDGRSACQTSKAEARVDSPFAPGEFGNHFAPTHVYEPITAKEQAQPCTVPTDMWEFLIDSQVYVRHHRRPRRELFSPEEFLDGPDPRDLQDVRVTLLSNEAEPVIDSWRGVTNVPREPWVGVTYFFGKGAKQLDKVSMLSPPSKVHVTLKDGTVLHADPSELRLVCHNKVHHFDLSSAQRLDLHHAAHLDIPRSHRKGRFEVPLGEFGSEHSKSRPQPRDRSHATASSSNRRQRCSDWGRMATGLVDLIHLHQDLEAHIVTMRLAKHRAPSVMAGLDAMAKVEKGPEMMPGTAPPVTTTAPGQIKRTGGMYPQKVEECRHHPDLARRTGNNHGQFMECLACGKMWKAVTYTVPYTGETMPVYVKDHGRRMYPGRGDTVPTARKTSVTKRKDSTALSSTSGHTEGPMQEDEETEEPVDLRKLTPEERERVQRVAAQRLEDRRQDEARARRDHEARAREKYLNPGGGPKLRVGFEEPLVKKELANKEAPAVKKSGTKVSEADRVSISSSSFSDVAVVTDPEE
ncbi:unnamed protein product [Symbiodinium sp. CCMP2592]|nr:unnamed protein product [Symbiodinium sp. CCMP2592]